MRNKYVFQTIVSVAISLVFVTTGYGKTVFISDIDDTVKPTNVRSIGTAISNALSTDVFLGMDHLFLALACDDSISKAEKTACLQSQGRSSKNQRTFHYVTGFPALDVVQHYIRSNNFPRGGSIRSKPVWENMFDFKLEQHLDIILEEQPTTVVLIGDNGQVDPEVFAAVQDKVSSLTQQGALKLLPAFHVFIHSAYDSGGAGDAEVPQLNDQNSFLGFFDLGIQLSIAGLLKNSSLKRLSQFFKASLEDSSSRGYALYLPEWTECKDYFKWYRAGTDGHDHPAATYLSPHHRWNKSYAGILSKHTASLEQFEKTLERECL